MGRVYTVQFNGVAITATQDLFELTGAAGKPFRVLGLFLAQTTDFGDAQEEILPIFFKSGQTTSGSGGSAPTPNPVNPTDVAAGFSAEVNNTTKASAGTILTHHSDGWNVRIPTFIPIPEKMQAEMTGGRRFTVELGASPVDSITVNGTLYVEELG